MTALRQRVLAAARRAPRIPVLPRDEDETAVQNAAREILESDPRAEDLAAAERALLEFDGPLPLGPVLALKLARSQLAIAAFPPNAALRVLFPMYRETKRLQPYGRQPGGEDLFRNKIRQLDALFAARPRAWRIVAVDDGCPEGSARQALAILRRDHGELLEQGVVTVLRLEDAIAAGEPEAKGICGADASSKGGSVLYGLRWMQRRAAPGDVLLYTDADLSTHLGQAGLLAGPIVAGEADMMAGSRRERDSVQIKSPVRCCRGRIFIHLWKRMLPLLHDIVDSQAGFKAFGAGVVAPVLDEVREIGFSIDLELMLLCRLKGLRIGKAGICFIDSEAESATSGHEVHLLMLKRIAALRRRHLPPDSGADAAAKLVDSLDLDAWHRLLSNPPAAILNAPLERLGDHSLF